VELIYKIYKRNSHRRSCRRKETMGREPQPRRVVILLLAPPPRPSFFPSPLLSLYFPFSLCYSLTWVMFSSIVFPLSHSWHIDIPPDPVLSLFGLIGLIWPEIIVDCVPIEILIIHTHCQRFLPCCESGPGCTAKSRWGLSTRWLSWKTVSGAIYTSKANSGRLIACWSRYSELVHEAMTGMPYRECPTIKAPTNVMPI
jgi:hypothetical protein